MADIVPVLNNPQVESVEFNAAVSENMLQTIAGAQTFLNYFTYAQKRFDINGLYSLAPSFPQYGVDGISVFEFNAQIIDVWLFNQIAGSSGSTTVDIQVMASPGGTWTSIFTTQPSISWQAGNDIWTGAVNPALIGSQYNPLPAYVPPPNTTAAVLNSVITDAIPAWTAMRCVLNSAQVGGQNSGVILHFRNV